MTTEAQVHAAQEKWGTGIVEIGKLKDDWEACKACTEQFLHDRYASFEDRTILFKPTKAVEQQFRLTRAEALSYFIDGDDRACPEDKGFAIAPPSTNVRFENVGMILEEDRALAMGNYFFTNPDGKEQKVEYTFGYTVVDGELKIDVHHSSAPFNPDPQVS